MAYWYVDTEYVKDFVVCINIIYIDLNETELDIIMSIPCFKFSWSVYAYTKPNRFWTRSWFVFAEDSLMFISFWCILFMIMGLGGKGGWVGGWGGTLSLVDMYNI